MSISTTYCMVIVSDAKGSGILSDEDYARFRPFVHDIQTIHARANGMRVCILETHYSGSTSPDSFVEPMAELWKTWSKDAVAGGCFRTVDCVPEVVDSLVNTSDVTLTAFTADSYRHPRALEDAVQVNDCPRYAVLVEDGQALKNALAFEGPIVFTEMYGDFEMEHEVEGRGEVFSSAPNAQFAELVLPTVKMTIEDYEATTV